MRNLVLQQNQIKQIFVYSKSEYTTKIGQCVRPSGRLHDNSSKTQTIGLKFCCTEWSQQYLGRVRR
jgi:hypothetical protein